MSSPNINNLILLGCVLMYVSVFVQERNEQQVTSFCRAKTYLVLMGFALAFGALFSKTWRIHVIFANKQLKKKVVRDVELVGMVLVLVVVDLFILLLQEGIDPVDGVTYNTSTTEVEDGAAVVQTQVVRCESRHGQQFSYALYGVQALLLLLGAFLAWETRKVKIPALNDSQEIGLCIYNVVVLSVVTLVVSLALKDNVTLKFVTVSLFIVVGTSMTQCLIFVPKLLKMREIRVSGESEEEYVKGARTGGTTTTTTTTQASEPGPEHLQQQLHEARLSIMQKDEAIKKLKEQLEKN